MIFSISSGLLGGRGEEAGFARTEREMITTELWGLAKTWLEVTGSLLAAGVLVVGTMPIVRELRTLARRRHDEAVAVNSPTSESLAHSSIRTPPAGSQATTPRRQPLASRDLASSAAPRAD